MFLRICILIYPSTSTTNVSYENTKGAQRIKDSLDRIKSLKQVDNENNVHKWPKNTVLVASDSMLSKLDERNLSQASITDFVNGAIGISLATILII